jgi:hypothetical protein
VGKAGLNIECGDCGWLSKINCQQIFPVTSVGRHFSKVLPVRPWRKMTARGIMGHYTIRTNDDEDQAIKRRRKRPDGIGQQNL